MWTVPVGGDVPCWQVCCLSLSPGAVNFIMIWYTARNMDKMRLI